MWFVYMVRCADDTLYTGIAKDVARRVGEHNSDNALGANYTRARRPVALVYTQAVESRSAAAKREHEIKQLTRSDKDELLKRAGLKARRKAAAVRRT
jgi:putative endonuclease